MSSNQDNDHANGKIPLCTIKAPHGVKGQAAAIPHLNEPEWFFESGLVITKNKDPFQASITGHKKGLIIIQMPEITTKDMLAEGKIIGTTLFVLRSSFPPLSPKGGEVYIADILEATVIAQQDPQPESAPKYGTVSDVVNFGSGNMIEVTLNKNHPLNSTKNTPIEYYYRNDGTITNIDTANRRITVIPPTAQE